MLCESFDENGRVGDEASLFIGAVRRYLRVLVNFKQLPPLPRGNEVNGISREGGTMRAAAYLHFSLPNSEPKKRSAGRREEGKQSRQVGCN